MGTGSKGALTLTLFVVTWNSSQYGGAEGISGAAGINGTLEVNVHIVTTLTASAKASVWKFSGMERIRNSSALTVLLNSKQPLCTLVSLQDGSKTPLIDDDNMRYQGYWETMTTSGAITLPKRKYSSFYLILRLLPSDMLCQSEPVPRSTNFKTVDVVVVPSASDSAFLAGWSIPLLVYLVFIFQSFLLAWVTHRVRGKGREFQITPAKPGWWRQFLNKLVPPDIVTLDRTCTKSFACLKKRSRAYVRSVLPIAIYYSLPALQLAYRYLYALHVSGDLDLCYYNFRCAYPVGTINDFNHVYSNTAYLAAGIAAAVWLRTHDLMHRSQREEGYGVPSHTGLGYALSLAIIFEGVLSASYHLCPNQSNFHHDTCFMYIGVTLVAIKLYQARHPDAKLGAPTTFCLLGIIMLADLGGDLIELPLYFVIFSLFHIFGYILLATQMYFLGRRPLCTRKIFTNIKAMMTNKPSSNTELYLVASRDKVYLFYVGLLINIGIALVGGVNAFSAYFSDAKGNFGSHLLFLLATNMFTYFVYYLAMKIIHGERFSVFSLLQLTLSLIMWVLGMYQFTRARTQWRTTPAGSRTYNEECAFYDSHDYWHMLSAFALYTTLLGLESLDIKLLDTPHKNIAVF